MTVKIAVSLPDELVADARAAVEAGRAASVSAYVADALRAKRSTKSLREVLDLLDAELGPAGPAAEAWAKEQLDRFDR
jgi:Arc/MetJ-type ribon-helix-helix transcriptional regulator